MVGRDDEWLTMSYTVTSIIDIICGLKKAHLGSCVQTFFFSGILFESESSRNCCFTLLSFLQHTMTKMNDPLVKDGWFMEKNEMWPGQGIRYFFLLEYFTPPTSSPHSSTDILTFLIHPSSCRSTSRRSVIP